MATLEDAAEQLVVRLKGLDSEIEESRQALAQGRERVEEASREVEEGWTALTEAVTSLREKLREEEQQLAGDAEEALQASSAARGVVRERGGEARSEVAEGKGDLVALSQHAVGLEPGVESLVTEAGEAPAHGLAERAREVEEQLADVLDDACEFLRDEVVTALGELAEDIQERCQAVKTSVAEEAVADLEKAFEDWEAKVDDLEAYVAEQGFTASHSHARAFVEWALTECLEACGAHLDGVGARVEEAVRPLQELGSEVRRVTTLLAGDGAELVGGLADTRESVARAASALDSVRDLLASFSFVQG